MSYLNQKRTGSLHDERQQARMDDDAHVNFMGGRSFDINDPLVRLRAMAASCFFGEPQYYKSSERTKRKRSFSTVSSFRRLSDDAIRHLLMTLGGADVSVWADLTPAKALEAAIDSALEHDLEGTLRLAVDLRRQDNIRVTPQVIVVRAAYHKAAKGSGLIRKYAGLVMRRGDEPATQMAYTLEAYGRKAIPNGLKRAWADFLSSRNEYQLAKYRLDSRKVKTVDVVNLSHAHSAVIDSLVKGDLRLGDEVETWESIRSSGGSWEQAVEVMGHMALLRNLRNLIENKVDSSLYLDKFVSGALEGKQLPFRYFSAFQAVKKISDEARVLDAIEQAMRLSLGNLPVLPGRTLALADNSGSAQNTTTSSMGTVKIATIGNLMGILTAMIAKDGGMLGVFGDRLSYLPVRKTASILDQLQEAEELGGKVGQATEHGVWLALDEATHKKEVYDTIFVYSDMQAGHGGLYGTGGYSDFVWPDDKGNQNIDVPKLIQRYRSQVNPKVAVFLVQTAGYEDTIMPEYYDRTYILGGWSDGILRFATKMLDITDGQTQE